MNNNSASKKDDDSSSMGMVSINIGGSPEPHGREYLDKRRRYQTKENVAMLGVLESIGDDDSYVEDTLASMEYSVSTSHGSFLRELTETTAPYTGNMPRWKYWLRRMSRKIIQRGRKILQQYRIPLQKYGPYFVVVMVYLTIRFVLYNPATPSPQYSDTDKMTLNSYRDSYLNQLQSREGGATITPNGAPKPPNGETSLDKSVQTNVGENIAATQYPPLYRSKYEVKDGQEDDPMALPPKKPEQPSQQQTQAWMEFSERVKKLREISERGRAAANLPEKPPPQEQPPQQESANNQQDAAKPKNP